MPACCSKTGDFGHSESCHHGPTSVYRELDMTCHLSLGFLLVFLLFSVFACALPMALSPVMSLPMLRLC